MGVCGSGLYKRMLMPGQLFCDGLARNRLVGIGFSYDAGFHVSSYLGSRAFVPGMISKRGSKSTMVEASCFKMLASPSTFAVPSAI